MGWYEDGEIEAESAAVMGEYEAGEQDGWDGAPRSTGRYDQEAYDRGYYAGLNAAEKLS